MAKAVWNGVVLAESDETVVVEGNHYFPRASLNFELFTPTEHRTVCGWKGEAHYFTIQAGGETYDNAAWTYPEPKDAAKQIKGHVAFYRGVTVEG